jgi:succinate dehydrogenase / fumarate reductase, cytochrome b subunit
MARAGTAEPGRARGAPTAVFNRGLWSALRYRGREGMWTWILHRLTGLGILVFLVMHVVETATVIYYPGIYDSFLAAYRSPVFRVAEVIIVFAVLYHAANGLRIIVQDFWPLLMQRQRELTWAVAAVVVLAMLPITWIMMAPVVGLREEPGTARHEARCLEQPEAPACQHAPVTTEEVQL